MSYSIFESSMVEMKWPDVEKAIEAGAIALLPTGVIEEHGPHMGLGVDIYLASLLAGMVKKELETENIRVLTAPTFYWGINSVTGAFPGSFTVRSETMVNMLADILASLKRWGLDQVFVINWHDDFLHCKVLAEAINKARNDCGARAYVLVSRPLSNRLGLTGNEDHIIVYDMPQDNAPRQGSPDIHAGAGETGIMAAYFRDEVDMELAKTLKAADLSLADFKVWRRGWNDARRKTPLGYLGNPSGFDANEGENYMKVLCKAVSGSILNRIQTDM